MEGEFDTTETNEINESGNEGESGTGLEQLLKLEHEVGDLETKLPILRTEADLLDKIDPEHPDLLEMHKKDLLSQSS